jgi:hypothetical protein
MENEIQNEIVNADKLKYDNVKKALEIINKKENKFLFFVVGTPNPSASMYEVYHHATVVKNMGYEVSILTDSPEYTIPTWIESELTDFKHESVTEVNLTVGPADVLVIPEIFSNVMEQTKHLPCLRIGLLQSMDYMINALVPATDWNSFGINKVITTSETLKNLFEDYYGKNLYDVRTYRPNIPEYFLDENEEIKRPVISIIGRNPNEVSKVVKLFYAKYPQYQWIGFDSMVTESKPPQSLSRKQYADRLKINFASVWIDRISSFGTLPLEAMKAGSIPIGVVPDIIPEYLLEKEEDGTSSFIENSGVWSNDLYSLPMMIGDVVTKFLDDTIDNQIYETMRKIASNYTPKESETDLVAVYSRFLEERKNLFEIGINEYESNLKEEDNNKKENK